MTQKDAPFSTIRYDTIFDDEVLGFLGTKDFKTAIEAYVKKYNELLDRSNCSRIESAKPGQEIPVLVRREDDRTKKPIGVVDARSGWSELLSRSKERGWHAAGPLLTLRGPLGVNLEA